MKKQKFGIFAPILGEKKDFPTILLDKTVQTDNRDIVRMYGEIWRRKMRDPDLLIGEIHNQANAAADAQGEVDGTAGWSEVGATISSVSTDPQTGTFHLKAVAGDGSYDQVTYSFTAVIGKKYYVSVWLKRGAQGTTQHMANWVGCDFGYKSVAAGAWAEYTFVITATATTITMRFYTCTDGAIGDELYVDNVSITRVIDKSQTPDTYPILHYHTFVKRATGMQYKLAFTKAHIYCWNPLTKVWDLKFTCSSSCTEWDTITYNDRVIATNNVDLVLVWDTTGLFVGLDHPTNGVEYSTGHFLTKAKYVSAFENFLILGYTTEEGVVYPQRERWSAVGEGEVTGKWKTGDAGAKETYGSDVIMGFKVYAGQFVIFKAKSRIIQKLISTAEVWNWVILPGNIGLLSNHSIVEDPDGRVYWLANDMTIREMELGEVSQLIDSVVKLIEPSSAHLVYGAYIEETGEMWWSIPYDNALNNKVITLKVVDGIVTEWGELNLAIPAIGSYKED